MTPEERQTLLDDYVYEVADGMDHKTAFHCLIDYLTQAYEEYTDDELLTEVKDTYPHLLETNVQNSN
jgi:hypothetical protein